jgi:hypothetical protein
VMEMEWVVMNSDGVTLSWTAAKGKGPSDSVLRCGVETAAR